MMKIIESMRAWKLLIITIDFYGIILTPKMVHTHTHTHRFTLGHLIISNFLFTFNVFSYYSFLTFLPF